MRILNEIFLKEHFV